MDDAKVLAEAISTQRFSRYLAWAAGNHHRALALYTLNTRLSESLYTPLQMLEVALRNRIDGVLSAAFDERWYDRPEFQKGTRQAAQLAKAREDLAEDGKQASPDRIVAALTFGYWTAFFGSDYEAIWRATLYKIAQHSSGKGLTRKQLSAPLTPIRILRNRIAHHEPILHWNLPRHHDNMIELIGWLSSWAAAWCRENSRFPVVYPRDGIVLVGGSD